VAELPREQRLDNRAEQEVSADEQRQPGAQALIVDRFRGKRTMSPVSAGNDRLSPFPATAL
jgi:hypothetical protein